MPVLANITSSTTVKSSSGKVKNFSVMVAGSSVGTINDVADKANAAAANAYLPLPKAEGTVVFPPEGMVFASGIAVVPGTGQTISIEYE